MNCDHIWVTPFSIVSVALKAPEYGASVNGDYSYTIITDTLYYTIKPLFVKLYCEM